MKVYVCERFTSSGEAESRVQAGTGGRYGEADEHITGFVFVGFVDENTNIEQ